MANWKDILTNTDWKSLIQSIDVQDIVKQVAVVAEGGIDKLKTTVQETLDKFSDVQVVVYRGYGAENKVFIKGRVLKSKKVSSPMEQDTTFINMLNMYKRFESDEIAEAVIEIKFHGENTMVVTDIEGYFELELNPTKPLATLPHAEHFEVHLQSSPIGRVEAPIIETGQIFVPPATAEYGIISDIDDTIIETSATDVVKMLQNTFTKNAFTRVPFEGVRDFYRALQQGKSGNNHNPMFYVSSSPWNLYDFLVHLIDVHDLPEGVMCLRDYGLDTQKAGISAHGEHKIAEITKIMNTYPHLPFILIGDSGQQDAPSYRKIAELFPDRVLAIYIRDVKDPQRLMFVNEVFKDFYGAKTQVCVMQETQDAVKHAAMNGWIANKSL